MSNINILSGNGDCVDIGDFSALHSPIQHVSIYVESLDCSRNREIRIL